MSAEYTLIHRYRGARNERAVSAQPTSTEAWVASEVWRGRPPAWPLIVRRPDREQRWECRRECTHPGKAQAGVPAAGDEGTGAGLGRDRAQPGGPQGCALTTWALRGHSMWTGPRSGRRTPADTSPMTWRKWGNSSQTDFGSKGKKKTKWSWSVVSNSLRTDLCSAAQSCLTLCNPMDCNPPGSSVRGIFQARILEWVSISSSRGSAQPRKQTCVSCVSCMARGLFTSAPPGKPPWEQIQVSSKVDF